MGRHYNSRMRVNLHIEKKELMVDFVAGALVYFSSTRGEPMEEHGTRIKGRARSTIQGAKRVEEIAGNKTVGLGLHVLFLISFLNCSAVNLNAQTKHWVTGYFPGWDLGDGTNSNPPLSAVDFSAMTVVAYFGCGPTSDGVVDTSSGSVSYKGASALVKTAHAAGTKVIITVGGWNTQSRFEGATSSSNLEKFVKSIIGIMKEYRCDGVDLDWEPLSPSDYNQFTALTKDLRRDLPPPYLLTTTALPGDESIMGSLYQYFDQINIMTYDLMGAWQGWVTWYNSALYDEGVTSLNGWKHVPACDNLVRKFISAGVPRNKLGIGAEFSGTIWKGGVMTDGNGVTGPDEAWVTPPTVQPDVPLYWHDGSGIMQKYYTPQRHRWDPKAMVPYLSIDNPGTANDMFISYDDSASVAAKADYIRKQHLSGIILYELGWGYPGNNTYPLLEDVKKAFGRSLEH